MSETNSASVIRFEQAVYQKEYETACTELLAILTQIDRNFGGIDGIECDIPIAISALTDESMVHFCTRMAVAITDLFRNPELTISESGAQRLFISQRWIAAIFACSPYTTADHILRSYNVVPSDDINEVTLPNNLNSLTKFCILYLPDSVINLNLDALWDANPTLCASLCLALCSPRFTGTEEAFNKRHGILQWFPKKLAQLTSLDNLPANILHDIYMHCSYDIAENKHTIKKSVNEVIRRHLMNLNWQDRDVTEIGYKQGKPVMVVMLEHFYSSHSIYRTHSTSMIVAKEKFYLVGVGNHQVDQIGQAVFDEFHSLSEPYVLDRLYKVKQLCDELKPAIFYMPSIGMDLNTIFASNTRFAPIQAIALGHPATTHSDFIEYVIVEDHYVGKEECFSETLLRLPKDALPYVPSSLAPSKVEYRLRNSPEVVQIAIAATTMKLNPYFLKALQVIRDRTTVKVHFHFLLGQSIGITHPYVSRFIKCYLGSDATAHSHLPYPDYLAVMHQCDMVLNPFPFGNTNGIIDMVTLGLVGICKTGDEVHEHIDEGLFKRLGLPEWLITQTVDDYVECAIRLIENHQERLEIRRHIIENNALQTLFTGDASPMGNILFEKLTAWAKANNLKLQKNAKPKAKKVVSKTTTPKNTVEKKAKKKTNTAPKTVVKKPTVKKATEKPAKSTSKEMPSKTTAKRSTVKKVNAE